MQLTHTHPEFTEELKKQLAQKCFYANIYSIDQLGKENKISYLLKFYGLPPILNFMCLFFMKVIKISKIENVIADKTQLEFIIRNWLVNNHDKDIREFAIIIQNGITGEYGPTYNKVGIDSLGTWTKSYTENTKPKLMERIKAISAQSTTTKTLALSSPSTTTIPCPADIREATNKLIAKYNIDYTPKKSYADQRKEKLRKYLGIRDYKPEYPVKKVYGSLEDYCEDQGIDAPDFISKFEENILSSFSFEGDIHPNDYLEQKKREFLNRL